ncbi:MAG: hypothetical protein U0V64_12505 [Cyclobacteriaceae bacterium]
MTQRFWLLTWLFCGLLPGAVYSQVDQAGRFEMSLEANEVFPLALPAADQGVLLYRKFIGRTEDPMELIQLDTALNEVWKGYVPVKKDYAIVRTSYLNKTAYLLLVNRLQPRADFLLYAVGTERSNYSLYTIKNYIPFAPVDFVITREAAWISGSYNYRPLVLHYNFATQKSRILPGFFNEPGELCQVKANPKGEVDVIVSSRNQARAKCLWIRTYDQEGYLLKTTVLEPEKDKSLMYGRSVITTGDDQVVAGTYGRSGEYSRGVFVARVNPFGEYRINYYNYGDLKNFFRYMRAKQEQRVKERIERRRVKGKRIRFNYRVMVDELIPYGDNFLLLGEAFFPHYSTRYTNFSYPTYPLRGFQPAATRGETVLDYYQYTHAVILCFDKQGKLLWDNSFEINDIRTPELMQFVKIRPEPDRVVMSYLYDNTLRSKIISGDQVIEGKTFDRLEKTITKVRTRRDNNTEMSRFERWYGPYMMAYGVRRNPNIWSEDLRKTFFLSKIIHK